MRTLLDTNVLLDILLQGSTHGDESEGRLADALLVGPVFVNDIVAAELAPVFEDEQSLWDTLAQAQVRLDPYPRGGIYLAGQAFLRYRRRGGGKNRILPDFMIAAHAVVTETRLLTRDRGFYRDYFPQLRLAK